MSSYPCVPFCRSRFRRISASPPVVVNVVVSLSSFFFWFCWGLGPLHRCAANVILKMYLRNNAITCVLEHILKVISSAISGKQTVARMSNVPMIRYKKYFGEKMQSLLTDGPGEDSLFYGADFQESLSKPGPRQSHQKILASLTEALEGAYDDDETYPWTRSELNSALQFNNNVLRGYAKLVITVGKAGAQMAKQFANLISADANLEMANKPELLCQYLTQNDDPLALVHWMFKVFNLIEHFEPIYAIVQFNTLLTSVSPAGVIAMQTSLPSLPLSLSLSLSLSHTRMCLYLPITTLFCGCVFYSGIVAGNIG